MITLIVTRSKFLLNLLSSTLKYNKYSVDTAFIKEYNVDLLKIFKRRDYNSIVIEIDKFPDNFFNLIDYERYYKKPQLIGIIRNNDWRERVRYLKMGFNEIFSYPFPTQELITKINNFVPYESPTKSLEYSFGDISIDIYNQKVIKNNKEIAFNKKEFQILEYLAKNSSRVISRNELFDHVWDYQKINSSNTVDVHISRIRKKLKQNIIATFHGSGYKIKRLN